MLAPLHAEVADGPEGGQAQFLLTEDGMRIRVAQWACDAPEGTILLFPGRTECIEKYGRAAADLRARGFATMVVDWRGQGLADRMLPDPARGHVADFDDYQRDVRAMLAQARALDLPRPWYLLAHSMGGCIALRTVMDGLSARDMPFRAVAFTAPMWGILIAPLLRPLAWGLSTAAVGMGRHGWLVPGQTTQSYMLREGFANNLLTGDAEMFAYMCRQLQAHPALALGGPTLGWLNAALRETRALAARPSPALPVLTLLGTAEGIVDVSRIHGRMADWPGGRLEMVPGARHEVMMESPAIRARVFDAVADHFRTHREAPSAAPHPGPTAREPGPA